MPTKAVITYAPMIPAITNRNRFGRNMRMMPNDQAEPPPTRDVNRDSGTDSANGGWLQRIVRCKSVSTLSTNRPRITRSDELVRRSEQSGLQTLISFIRLIISAD